LTDIDSKKDIGLSCTRTDANSEPRHSLASTKSRMSAGDLTDLTVR